MRKKRMDNHRGEANPKAKLTNRKVKHIRKMYARGITPKIIGKKYSITGSHVCNITSRRIWSHI